MTGLRAYTRLFSNIQQTNGNASHHHHQQPQKLNNHFDQEPQNHNSPTEPVTIAEVDSHPPSSTKVSCRENYTSILYTF